MTRRFVRLRESPAGWYITPLADDVPLTVRVWRDRIGAIVYAESRGWRVVG